jgi:hypothetical protein
LCASLISRLQLPPPLHQRGHCGKEPVATSLTRALYYRPLRGDQQHTCLQPLGRCPCGDFHGLCVGRTHCAADAMLQSPSPAFSSMNTAAEKGLEQGTRSPHPDSAFGVPAAISQQAFVAYQPLAVPYQLLHFYRSPCPHPSPSGSVSRLPTSVMESTVLPSQSGNN